MRSVIENKALLVMSIVLTICSSRVTCQELKQLFVGDILPAFELQHTVNFPEDVAHSSQLQGKLIVIDFWSTSCSGCIKTFPKIAELAARFKDDVHLILVNPFETAEEVMKRMEARYQSQQIPDVPQIYGDKRWLTMFPVQTMPHIVFISSTGKVISQTSSYNLNTKRLEAILENEQNALDMIPKLASLVQFQHDFKNTPLSDIVKSKAIDLGGRGSFWSFDAALGFYGVSYPAYVTDDSTSVTCKFVNTAPLTFLRSIVMNLKEKGKFTGYLRDDRIVWLTEGKNFLLRPDEEFEWDAWAKATNFNYELTRPLADTCAIDDIMLDDLNLYLASHHGVQVELVKQNKSCFVINYSDSTRIKSRSGDTGQEVISISSFNELNNTLERMFAELDLPQTFLRDDSRALEIAEISFSPINSIQQIGELAKRLKQFGIVLSVEYHDIDVVVVSQKTR